jgi:hypothetical protein
MTLMSLVDSFNPRGEAELHGKPSLIWKIGLRFILLFWGFDKILGKFIVIKHRF